MHESEERSAIDPGGRRARFERALRESADDALALATQLAGAVGGVLYATDPTDGWRCLASSGARDAAAPDDAARCTSVAAAVGVLDDDDTTAHPTRHHAGIALREVGGECRGVLLLQLAGPLPAPAREALERLARRLAAHAQAAAGRPEAPLHVLFDLLRPLESIAIRAVGADGRIVFWNRGCEHLHGWPAAEAEGRDAASLLLPDPATRAAEREHLRALFQHRAGPHLRDLVLARADGDTVPASVAQRLLELPGQTPVLLDIAVDASERERAVAAVRDSEQLLRTVADNAPGAFLRYTIGVDGRIALEFISGGCRDIWDASPEELTADPGLLWDVIDPEDRPIVEESVARCSREAMPWSQQWRITTRRGNRRHLQGAGSPQRRADGTVVWDTAVLDITREKQVEAALATSEARLRTLIEASPEAIVVLDVALGTFVDANCRAAALFGLDRAALLASGPLELSPAVQPDGRPSRDAARAWIDLAVAGGCPEFEWTHRRSDGTPVPCAINLVRIPDPERVLVRGSMTDISEKQRAERSLRESEQRFRSLVSGIETIAVQGYDRERRIIYWNHASELLYGWTEAEALGRRLEELIIPPELRPAVVATIDRWLRDGRVAPRSEELTLVHRDGTPLPVFSSHVMQLDARGEPELFCLDMDLRELRRAEAALREANRSLALRNLELERFVMVASHDLQEPLRKVQTFGDRLAGSLGERLQPAEADYLDRMMRAAGRMRELIQDLLDYSSVTSGDGARRPVALSGVVRGVLEDLEDEIAASAADVRLPELPVVCADPVQMRQVFQNLLSNAIKYRAPGRAPLVRIESSPALTTAGGAATRIAVIDNGIGFDPGQSERIFAPFQRLHAQSEYRGTGIGLAIVRRIAEQLGGSAEAHGVPGEGARFEVVLPLA
jgi:PAS domain S-box-containing protein